MSKIAQGIGRLCNEVAVKANGSYVYTRSGKKLLDMSSGIGVVNTGHCHPKVIKAVQEQAENLMHAQVNIFYHDKMLELCDVLSTTCVPDKMLDCFFFWNSGAEAVEASIKLARQYTKKTNIICFEGSYHGRTFGTMGLTTSKTIYKAGFGPFMTGIEVSSFPYCLHCTCKRADPIKYSKHCCLRPIQELELLLKQRSAPEDTAAVLIEPILGEGGYVVPPTEFMMKLRELCTRNDILLIFDEVQSGFGRTGKYFACEHFNVNPDILIMAKGIASGLPLSCIASSKEIMDSQKPGSMGGTYAGNAISCAAAIATIKVFEEENLLEKSTRSGRNLINGLEERLKPILKSHLEGAYEVDIRGKGLMIGIEFYKKADDFVFPYDSKQPSIAAKMSKYCIEKKGMIILTASVFDTLRLIPPLNISEEEIALVLDNLEEALKFSLSKQN